MSSRRPLTTEEVGRLRYMLNNDYSYRAMSKAFGVCTDTLKRMLVREGLAEFDGAKYAVSPKPDWEMWERPCMRCKDDKPRPKWQYICDRCKRNTNSTGVSDEILTANLEVGIDE